MEGREREMSPQLARNQVPPEQTWDLSRIYPTVADWERDLARADELAAQLEQYRGRLQDGPDTLLACLRCRSELLAVGLPVMYYARNRQREDQSDTERRVLLDRAQPVVQRGNTALSFIKPEVLALPPGTVAAYLEAEPELRIYRQFLADWLAEQEHALTPEAEAVFAGLSDLLGSPVTLYHAIRDGDLRFDMVIDQTGEEHSAGAGYGKLIESPDRSVRLAAYEAQLKASAVHRHSLAANLATAVKRDVAVARLRRYPSSLAAAVGPVHLDEAIYHNLLRVAEAGSRHYRRYLQYRQRALGISPLLQCDLWCPLEPDQQIAYTFAEAFALIREALVPLGPEYGAILRQAEQERWIDWADNAGKMSGAASFDCPGKPPVIMLTWTGTLADVFLLAHELGHAVNSVFTDRAQPLCYFGNPTLLAEIAAITNEVLLARHLLAATPEGPVRRRILLDAIGSCIGNFWDGSIMAAFQLEVHERAERGQPLTWETFCQTYAGILQRWYGDTVAITPEGFGSYWCMGNHSLYGFYGYQYATGWAVAAAFADAILTEGAPAVERYIAFLSGGRSARPLDLLRTAGVDLSSTAPVEAAVELFAGFVDELERGDLS